MKDVTLSASLAWSMLSNTTSLSLKTSIEELFSKHELNIPRHCGQGSDEQAICEMNLVILNPLRRIRLLIIFIVLLTNFNWH